MINLPVILGGAALAGFCLGFLLALICMRPIINRVFARFKDDHNRDCRALMERAQGLTEKIDELQHRVDRRDARIAELEQFGR